MPTEPEKQRTGHQRDLRAGRASEPFAVYAITNCVDRRRPVLAAHATAAVIIGSFGYMRTQEWIKLLAFCVMPDHYHALFLPLPGRSLSQIMSAIGKFTASNINKLVSSTGRFWQEGYFDHRCRSIDDALDRIVYIEQNPVRAGLAVEALDWPYSSADPSNAHLLDREWYAERC